MQAIQRSFPTRVAAACAATAVLIGGTFTAGAASATPSSDPSASSSPTAIATSVAPAPAASATSTDVSLPAGLDAAITRDLGMSVEEFNNQGALATKAAEVHATLTEADPAALVSVDGDAINVQTTAPDVAKAAAGDAKVTVSAAPAAPSFAKVDATSVDALFADYVGEFGAMALQSIMVNSKGEFVIRTRDAATTSPMPTRRSFTQAATPTTDDFAAKYVNVVVEAAQGPAGALANDVVNGQGYIAFDSQAIPSELCSIGWNGFNKDGDPAIISAGHCTSDGVLEGTELIVPLQDDAGNPIKPGGVLGEPLGTFGFSQFGGPGNSPAIDPFSEKPGNIGTDVSVIDGINTALTQLPKVTDWATPDSPKDSGPQVTGVSDAIIGTPICKSGIMTGWSCGTVSEVGAFIVAGKNYPKNPADLKPGEDLEDIRAVRGFGSTDLAAAPGDSGGSIIAGNLAVGMVSAGGVNAAGVAVTYGVSLTDALKYTAGYSVKIFLNAPKITTTGQVFRSTEVKGTVAGAPAGTTVSVTIDGTTTAATVGANGMWTAKAPNKFGIFAVTAQAKNGFNTSEATTGSIEVIKQTLAVPAITAPAQSGTVAAPVTFIKGTGKVGATIELTGDVKGTVGVATDGTWAFALSPALEVGDYTIMAKQTLKDWNDSKTATNKFKVVPAAPAITSPSDGQTFTFDEGPSAVSGSNIEGAAVSVAIDGKQYDATVVDGTWSVALDAKLGTGDYTVNAVQTLDEVRSLTASSTFSVVAAPIPPATQEPSAVATTAPAPAPEPTLAPAALNSLATTGASSSLLLLGGGGVVLLLGGAAFLLIRRRSTK